MKKTGLAIVAIALLASGCSVGTHNTSKGVCRDIQVCSDDGTCRMKNDSMTQSNCDMVGGTFEPINHKDGWFNF